MCHDSNWETLKRVRGGFSDRRLVLDLIRLSTLEAVKGAADDGERLEEHRERETKTPGAPADDWSAVLDRNRAAKNPEERGVFPFSIEATIGARIRSRVCGDGKRIKADIQSSTLWKQWGACGVKRV